MRSKAVIITGLFVSIVIFAGGCGGGTSSASKPVPAAQPPAKPAAMKGDLQAGRKAFNSVCTACHGVDGRGMKGLGKDLTASQWSKSQTDKQLVEFLKAGRRPDDPLNTTKVDMPPKGGNPAFTEKDLLDIVAYVRALQG
jgi:mono/diheme cytochrome c family protein